VPVVTVFVVRRLIVSFLILLASTFLIYVLVANAGDPLADLRTNSSPDRQSLIDARVDRLNLDEPIVTRYVDWLKGASGCFLPGAPCDLGVNRAGQSVTAILDIALAATVRLVLLATALAVMLGVSVGIVSALRQYTGFDYSITLMAFLFFSLPIFWVAVLLKQYLAIDLNQWLRNPTINPGVLVVFGVFMGIVWGSIIGGGRRRRWAVRIGVGLGSMILLQFLAVSGWLERPALGPGLIALLSFGAAVGVTALVAGLHRRDVLRSALVTAAIGSVAQFWVTPLLRTHTWATWGTIVLFAVLAIAVACVVGWFLGGLDRSQAIRASILTALLSGFLMFVDLLMRAYPSYARSVRGIVVATTGSNTPNYDGTFWQNLLDTFGHLVLPTIAIMLVSFATYSRYSRATMLETLNQDYVRTARSKGLTERTVVMRHAFRNALIPVITLAAFDFGAVVGGAIITETVFGWRGMGYMFVKGLKDVDPNPVMAFYLVTATAIFLFNLLADLSYAYLDPRIRLT
jgi:peptide/nickel transport system permease protein